MCPVRAIRVAYTGELGWELHYPIEFGRYLWDLIWSVGEKHGLKGVGARAQNWLRQEKSYRAFGNELGRDATPLEAALDRFVDLSKEFRLLVLGSAVAFACGTTAGVDPASDAGPSPTVTPTSPTPTPTANGLPCDVDAVLAKNCRSCHGTTPNFGATMPLTTHESLMAPAPSNPSKTVLDMVRARIRDDVRPMPQAPNPRLSAADMAILDAWATAGAPRSQAVCGGNDAGPVQPLDCKRALNIAPATPYEMPTTAKNENVCYGVDVTSPDDKHVIALAPRVENPKIVHHVFIFKSPTVSPSLKLWLAI